jgi:ADP-heptose:LPS heptosyltransferase
MKFYVRGGIGDFLQCSWFIQNNKYKEFIVHTHFKGAENFFKDLGVENASYYYFQNTEEHDEQIDKIIANHGENSTTNIRECPRAFYSDVNFSKESKENADSFCKKFQNDKPIIGIHPFGSGFSDDTYSRFNLPPKRIPAQIINSIIKQEYNYIIFGTASELSSYGVNESSNILHTNFDTQSCLEISKKCSQFIGTDSCFKTMSSMHRIPTLCVLGDFKDETRDIYFINQYEKDNIMKVYRVENFEKEKQNIIGFINSNIL